MALDGALDALGGAAPAMPKVSFTPEESAAADARLASPESKAELLTQIAGTKDPKAKGVLQDEYNRTFGNQSGLLSGALSALMSGDDSASIRSIAPPQPPKASQGATWPPAPPRAKELVPGIGETIANQVTGLGANILAGWRGLAHLATGGTLADAADVVHQAQESGTYQPQSQTGQNIVEALGSDYNPLNLPAVAARYAGGKLADAGLPGAGAAVAGVGTVLPMLLMRGEAPAAKRAPITIDQPPSNPAPVVSDVPAIWRKNAANQPVVEQPAVPSAPPPEAPQFASSAKEVDNGLRKVDTSAPESIGGPRIPEEAPTDRALPTKQQSNRAAILQRIGLTDARESAVNGNAKEAATDFQQSRVNNAAGDFIRSKLDEERAALTNHAEGIVEGTGGTIGTDEAALNARGNAIVQPLDRLKQWFDDQTTRLYQEAHARAQDVPLEMPKTNALIGGDTADFLGTVEGEQLLKGLKARMKSLGMTDAEGNPQAVTVSQAERLKQYLGEQWQPRTGRLISALKNSIDDDVLGAAGEDIYKQARAMRRMRAVTLDDPNGIAKIMDASGPEGINRAVPIARIPDTITSMPVEQLGHIVRTLKNVPEEIQPAAQAALNEIKAQFANRIRDAGASRVGQWGARDVSRYLNQNAAKLQGVFSPEELAKIKDLNDAGHILAKDQSYPGAAVQQHNLLQRGAMGAIQAGAVSAGGALGSVAGPAGAAVGAGVGQMIGRGMAEKMGERAMLKSAQKRFVKLSDVAR